MINNLIDYHISMQTHIKYVTIFGERCSGTNYLEELIKLNFDVEITWKYGWKHFFGFNQLTRPETNNTLFICIVKDIVSWMNSFFENPHHITHIFDKGDIDGFLNNEFGVKTKIIKNL